MKSGLLHPEGDHYKLCNELMKSNMALESETYTFGALHQKQSKKVYVGGITSSVLIVLEQLIIHFFPQAPPDCSWNCILDAV